MSLDIFEEWESEVRGYIRLFPTTFDAARGSLLIGEDGSEYIDFFAGAGTLNYGHNNPLLKQALLDYIERDGIIHALDLATRAKREFHRDVSRSGSHPRGLRYKLQFTGPTGANATEAAIKVARLATGRTNLIAFTRGYHGLSLGALATTAARQYRAAAGVPLDNVTFAPLRAGTSVRTSTPLSSWRSNSKTHRAASTGLRPSSSRAFKAKAGSTSRAPGWLRRLAALAAQHEIPLIIDDIQAGCGRSGDFFSFEQSGIRPDIVVLSKSLSGYGLPMSLVLISPELDVWEPGGHTGTFRGNNLAFVGATAALRTYWADEDFGIETKRRVGAARADLAAIVARHPGDLELRGRGLFWAWRRSPTRFCAAGVSRGVRARCGVELDCGDLLRGREVPAPAHN